MRGLLQVLYYLTNFTIVLIDIRHHRIPNKYLGLLFFIGVADGVLNGYLIIRFGESALLVIAIYLLLNYGTEKMLGYSAIGMGDI